MQHGGRRLVRFPEVTDVNILCYGDSNTYGFTTDWKGRYPRDVRWTGRLQTLLGPEHYVIEDGLNGRACAVPDTHRAGRSALRELPVALECHMPLDWLILAFGTNDVKIEKTRTLDGAAGAMEQLVGMVKQKLPPETRVLFITSAPLREPVLGVDPDFDALSIRLSEQLAGAHREICARYGIFHMDAGEVVRTSDVDGEHYDEANHAALAEAVARYILEHGKEDHT